MAIIFQEEKRIFTLHTKRTTYQFQADSYGFLLHLYYGKRTEGNMDYLLTYADRGFSGNPYECGEGQDLFHGLPSPGIPMHGKRRLQEQRFNAAQCGRDIQL